MGKKQLVRAVSVLLCLAAGALTLFAVQRKAGSAGGVRMVHAGPELTRILAKRAAEGAEDADELREGEVSLLERFPLGETLAGRFYPSLEREIGSRTPRKVYCPLAHYVNAPGWKAQMHWREHRRRQWAVEYSQAGFRNPYEPAETQPDVRVLLAGDSHIEAVVPYEETVAALLELGLRSAPGVRTAEVLNGASGGYDFYNYVGLLERNLHLAPDVFLVIVYGGNDFVGMLPALGYFQRLALRLSGQRWMREIGRVPKEHAPAISQAFQQVAHFAEHPEHVELALRTSVNAMREMKRICDREGIAFLCAYLPPQHDVRPQDMLPTIRLLSELFGLDEGDLRHSSWLADQFIGSLRAYGIEMVDLRQALRAEKEPLYWEEDHHVNTRGTYVVARELMPHLRPIVAGRQRARLVDAQVR